MRARLAQVRWILVVTTAALIYIVPLLLGLALSFPLLVMLTWVHLDPARAMRISVVISTLVVIIVTGAGALTVARRVERAALLHGFLVGLVVALLSLLLDLLFHPSLEPVGLILYGLMVTAGLLGGLLGSRGQEWP